MAKIKKKVFTDGTYEGELFLGKRRGRGTMTYQNGDVYVGDWENDLRHGEGTVRYANKDVYVGEWQSGEPSGKGTMTYASGDFYDGEWVSGDFVGGTAKKHYESGDFYDGDWQNGKPNGLGKMTYSNGDSYDGNWQNGKRCGEGALSSERSGESFQGQWKNNVFSCGSVKKRYESGDFYEGAWNGGKPHGKGKMTYANGDIFEGDWENGKQSGQGTMTHKNGDIFKGKWVDGEFSETVTRRFENGDVYDGAWQNGKPSGFGKMAYADGRLYEGNWVSGKLDGQGKMSYSENDGRISFEGKFKDDYPSDGTMSYTDGRIFSGTVNRYGNFIKGKLSYKNGSYLDGSWTYHDKVNKMLSDGECSLFTRDGAWLNVRWTEKMVREAGGIIKKLQHWYGTMRFENGDVYEGEWRNGWKDYEWYGSGTYVCIHDKTEYKSDCWRGVKTGYNVTRTQSGIVTEGCMIEGRFEENVTFEAKDSRGTFFIGHMTADESGKKVKNGFGIEYSADSACYRTGYWENNSLKKEGGSAFRPMRVDSKGYLCREPIDLNESKSNNGSEEIFSSASDKYEGETNIYGEKHGKGTMLYASGEKYSGDWMNNAWCGWGIYRSADGKKYWGRFTDVKESRNCYHLVNGKIDGDKIHGSLQNGKFFAD